MRLPTREPSGTGHEACVSFGHERTSRRQVSRNLTGSAGRVRGSAVRARRGSRAVLAFTSAFPSSARLATSSNARRAGADRGSGCVGAAPWFIALAFIALASASDALRPHRTPTHGGVARARRWHGAEGRRRCGRFGCRGSRCGCGDRGARSRCRRHADRGGRDLRSPIVQRRPCLLQSELRHLRRRGRDVRSHSLHAQD